MLLPAVGARASIAVALLARTGGRDVCDTHPVKRESGIHITGRRLPPYGNSAGLTDAGTIPVYPYAYAISGGIGTWIQALQRNLAPHQVRGIYVADIYQKQA